MVAISPASAATGAGGLTILHASSQDQAHVCSIVGEDATYEAVVCADLLTYEGASVYYAYARGEAFCQLTKAPHTEVACDNILERVTLQTGDNNATDLVGTSCGGENANIATCPDARLFASTANWDYSIAAAGGGTCSSNVDTAYQIWGVLWGGESWITTPDGKTWIVGHDGFAPNDGVNQSSGHFFVCP